MCVLQTKVLPKRFLHFYIQKIKKITLTKMKKNHTKQLKKYNIICEMSRFLTFTLSHITLQNSIMAKA